MHPRAAILADFSHSDQAKLIVFVFCFPHPTQWLLKLGDDAGGVLVVVVVVLRSIGVTHSTSYNCKSG